MTRVARISRLSLLLGLSVLATSGRFRGLVLTRPTGGTDGGQEGTTTRDALSFASEEVESLRQQVDAGRLVKNFGQKAQNILEAVNERAGSKKSLVAIVDSSLHSLFLRQLLLVQQQLVERFAHDHALDATLSRADKLFVSTAKDLVRTDSTWSFESVRDSLKAELTEILRDNTALKNEQERVAQTQRATAAVIGQLQKQMDEIGEKLKGTGAASPWMLWTSYRLPGTPFQVSGRYQEGRTNIELSLVRNKDPANAEAGFVEGLTPQNLGLSLNIGL